MVSIPGWIRVSDVHESHGELAVTIGVRVWHPMFIWTVLSQMRQHVDLRVCVAGHDYRVPWVIVAPVLVPFVAWRLRHAWRERIQTSPEVP